MLSGLATPETGSSQRAKPTVSTLKCLKRHVQKENIFLLHKYMVEVRFTTALLKGGFCKLKIFLFMFVDNRQRAAHSCR